MLQRRDVIYRGRVQGVGFRYTTRSIAERFDVIGFVQNLHDGGVRLVVEGEEAELDRFLTAIGETMNEYIASSKSSASPYQGDFQEFTIRPSGEGGD
jgi:acylphosphatase